VLDMGSLSSFKNGGLNLQEVFLIGQNEQEVLKLCKWEFKIPATQFFYISVILVFQKLEIMV